VLPTFGAVPDEHMSSREGPDDGKKSGSRITRRENRIGPRPSGRFQVRLFVKREEHDAGIEPFGLDIANRLKPARRWEMKADDYDMWLKPTGESNDFVRGLDLAHHRDSRLEQVPERETEEAITLCYEGS
jgi:hypothetical protein